MSLPTLNKIHQGDSLQVLKSWPDSFIQTVVTSPPYWGLRDYGVEGQIGQEATPEEFVAKMVELFREVRRVLKDDGTFWLNLGDSYAGSGQGWGKDKQYAGTKQATNRGSLNRHDAMKNKTGFARPVNYISSTKENGLKPKDLVGIPWRVAFALQSDGWYLRSDIIWSKPNPMPESVTDRPTKAHEYLFLLSKSDRYFYDADSIKEDAIEVWTSTSFIPDSFKDLQDTSNAAASSASPNGRTDETKTTRNKRSVWNISPNQFPEAHFATFPEKLIEPCILAGSRSGGGDIVLDPFMGAGTTALVSARLNRSFLGIELNPEYIKIADKRIQPELSQQKFEGVA